MERVDNPLRMVSSKQQYKNKRFEGFVGGALTFFFPEKNLSILKIKPVLIHEKKLKKS